VKGRTTGSKGTTSVRRVWERDEGICHICLLPCALEHATRDHIRPRSWMKGRQNNLRLAHKWCNWERADLRHRSHCQAARRVMAALHSFHDLTWFDPVEAFRVRTMLVPARSRTQAVGTVTR
jgi:hypothetical protein